MKKVLKWIVIGWAAFWALVIVMVVIAAVTHDPVKPKSVLRVTLRGEIQEAPGATLSGLLGEPGTPSLRGLTEAIRRAATDERIKGLLLEVQDPGVSVAQVEEIERAMAAFRQSGKWNVAYLETAGELGAGDASYALATSAAEVVLAPSGDINLAGVRATVPFFKGTLDKLEISPYFDKRYDYKTAANTFTNTELTPAHQESLKSLVDDIQKNLVEQMAARRQAKVEEVWQWIRSGPQSAQEALDKKMVDRLAYFDTVIAEAAKAAGRGAADVFLDVATYAGAVRLHERGPTIALIHGVGSIHRGESNSSFSPEDRTMGSDTIIKGLRAAREAGVKGILFRVDSPGGSYVASDLIHREIEVCREAKIPVVVSMGSYAASGGYFVAMGADRIIAEPSTITGSIGVFAGAFATRAFFQNLLGVTFGVYEAVPESSSFGGIDGLDEREKQQLSRALDRIYQDFVGKAAAGRKKTPDEIHKLAQGRVWSGRAALAHGLVDELGGIETAIERVKELAGIAAADEVSLQEFPLPETTLEALSVALENQAQVRLPRPLRAAAGYAEQLSQSPGESVLAVPFAIRVSP